MNILFAILAAMIVLNIVSILATAWPLRRLEPAAWRSTLWIHLWIYIAAGMAGAVVVVWWVGKGTP